MKIVPVVSRVNNRNTNQSNKQAFTAYVPGETFNKGAIGTIFNKDILKMLEEKIVPALEGLFDDETKIAITAKKGFLGYRRLEFFGTTLHKGKLLKSKVVMRPDVLDNTDFLTDENIIKRLKKRMFSERQRFKLGYM